MDMTREEMLKKLHAIKPAAVPTVRTMDMGIEFEFANADGANCFLGCFGEWPLLAFELPPQDKMNIIIKKIQQKELVMSDLEETIFKPFYATLMEEMENGYRENLVTDLNDFFYGLVDACKIHSDKYVYAFFDSGSDHGDVPDFFNAEEDLIENFFDMYEKIPYEKMTNGELSKWLSNIEEYLNECVINYLSCEKE